MLLYLLRKIRSFYSKLSNSIVTFRYYASTIGNAKISISRGSTFQSNVLLKATDGGEILVGKNAFISDHVKIVAKGGRIVIGDGVFIGSGSVIVAHEGIEIGCNSLIAEYVVIRDQDHIIDSYPIQTAGFRTAPIRIGSDTWIACKASILRGATLGDRCVVGAHALVRNHIPDGMLAVGVPARAIRYVQNQPRIE